MTQESSENTATVASDIAGTPVVSGMAYAPAMWVVRPSVPPATAQPIPEDGREAQFTKYEDAAATVAARLLKRSENTIGSASDVLKMSAGLAEDRGIRKEVRKAVLSGVPAVQALVRATDKFVEMFQKVGGLMAERVTDLRDVRDRVIAEIQGDPEPGIPVPDAPCVLLADDLAPADRAEAIARPIVDEVYQIVGMVRPRR